MIKVLAFYNAFLITVSLGFPTLTTLEKKSPEKVVAIVPAGHDDLQTAQTFYSGYNNNNYDGYPALGIGATVNGGYGWKGGVGYPNAIGSGIGIGVGVTGGYPPIGGYGGGYGAGYGGGAFAPGYGPGYGAEYVGYNRVPPQVTGGYGWKQGPNRWALI